MRSSGGCARAGWPARLSRRAAPLRRPGAGAPGVVVRGGRGAGPGVGGVPAVRTGSGATSVPEPPGRGAAGPHAHRRYGESTPCAPASRAGRARGPPGQRVAVRHPRRSGTPRGGAVPARGNAAGPAARWVQAVPGLPRPREEWLPRCRGPGPSTRLGWQVRSVSWSGRGRRCRLRGDSGRGGGAGPRRGGRRVRRSVPADGGGGLVRRSVMLRPCSRPP